MKRYVTFALQFTMCSLLLAGFAIGVAHLLFQDTAVPTSMKSDVSYTVVLDAGHGGRDGGTVAKDGTMEKDLNLAIAKRVKNLLRLAGIPVVMTRCDDIELADPASPHKKRDDLHARLQIVKDTENAVFVSIHMNSFPVEKYSGLQVYYSENNESSKLLADTLQQNIRLLDESNQRKTKKGNDIFLLSHMQNPAVLIECGFLSNDRERELLKTESYQNKMAISLSQSILSHLQQQ